MKRFIEKPFKFASRFPKLTLIGMLSLLGVCGFLISKITINSNQLDLLPQDIPTVQEARKVNQMIGGTGFIILTLKHIQESEADKKIWEAGKLKLKSKIEEGDALIAEANETLFDPAVLKENKEKSVKLKDASDELHEYLTQLPEIRYVRHKFSMEFVRNRMLYFLEAQDLKEAFRQLGLKRDDLIDRADPFYIDLGEPEYQVNLHDIKRKYSKVGKKEIDDDYYISPDKRMMVMVIKPDFSMNDITTSQNFVKKIKQLVKDKNFEQRGIKVGFTGSYIQYVDFYTAVTTSLRPTLILSFVLITFLLLLLMRKKRLIFCMVSSLVFSIVLVFGMTYLIIGELNIITSIIGGILAGLGIDFGIHLIHRFKEEYQTSRDLNKSILDSILYTGKAAIYSAVTTAGAFIVLIISDFKGFSEFGLIASYGIIITAICMFFVTPLQIIIYSKLFPKFLSNLEKEKPLFKEPLLKEASLLKYSKNIIIASILLLSVFSIVAPKIGFDHDYRNIVAVHTDSEFQQEEIHGRYEIAGDPLAIATDSIAEASALWDYLNPLSDRMKQNVAQVVSVFSFIPNYVNQQKNKKLIDQFANESSGIKDGMIPEKYKNGWQKFNKMMAAKPFHFEQVPSDIKKQFKNKEGSAKKGWLTFVYPRVDKLFLASDLKNIDDAVGTITFPRVSDQTILSFVHLVPEWEKKNLIPEDLLGRALSSDEKTTLAGKEIGNDSLKKALFIMNNMAGKEMAKLNIFPEIINEILTARPFKSVQDVQKNKKTVYTTGATLMVAHFTYIVKREAHFIAFGTFVLVLILLFISFRSVKSTFLVLIPLIVGTVLTCGLMVATGVKLNYFNVIVIPVLFGYGIDSSIFIYFRYLESGSIYDAVSKTGLAIITSSLTSLAAWGSLSAANHPGLQSIGFFAIIGISMVIVTTLFLLPSILYVLQMKQSRLIPQSVYAARSGK